VIAVSTVDLARLQEPDGCFPADVSGAGWARPDRNGFTTAMVLRALRDVPSDEHLARLRASAVALIERCRFRPVPGAFGFWPEARRPVWAPRLPADLDDTAIMTIELIRYGRLTRRDGLRTVCSVLIPNRVREHVKVIRPPWIAPGAFLTWVAEAGAKNVIDCCVNANAAALMALVGAEHLPGYEGAVSTIMQGIAWAGNDPRRQQAITPFYPSLHALEEAVAHAIACGATALSPALPLLRELTEGRPPPAECCTSAYGAVAWRCRALEAARTLRDQRARVEQPGSVATNSHPSLSRG
jgi:hypothetical protein